MAIFSWSANKTPFNTNFRSYSGLTNGDATIGVAATVCCGAAIICIICGCGCGCGWGAATICTHCCGIATCCMGWGAATHCTYWGCCNTGAGCWYMAMGCKIG